MTSQLRRAFSSISLKDRQHAETRLLNAVIILVGIGVAVGGASIARYTQIDSQAMALYVGLLSLFPIAYWLAQQGFVRLISLIMTGGLWLLVTGLSLVLGGIDAPVVSGYLLVIVLAAMLLGPTGGIVMSMVNAITLAALYRVMVEGALPEPLLQPDPGLQATVMIITYLIMATMLFVASRLIGVVIGRSRSGTLVLEAMLSELHRPGPSHDYVDNIIQSMKSMLIVLNPDGTIGTVNQTALQLLGYREDELIGMHFNTTILGHEKRESGEDPMSATELLSRHMTRNVAQSFHTKGGHEIPVSLSSAIMRDEDNVILGVVCVAHDETERRETEHKLKRQAALMEAVSDAIISTDIQLNIVSWNKAAERVYGWQAQEVLGKNLHDVVQHASDPDLDTQDPAETASNWKPEQTHYRKDGSILKVLSSISWIRDANNRPSGLVVVNHDITAVKEAEKELERRVEQLAMLRQIEYELSGTLDIKQVLSLSLRAAAGLSGASFGFIALVDDRAGAELDILGTPDQPLTEETVATHPAVAYTRETLEPLLLTERDSMPAIAARMQQESVSLMALPLVKQEQFIGMVELETTDRAFDTDIFEFLKLLVARATVAVENARLYNLSQKQLEELQTLYAHLSNLERIKTDMIRIASHDLRSPIGLINGYLTLLQNDLEGRVNEQETQFMSEIMRAVERMDRITRDLLSLERIQQVAEKDYGESVDMRELVGRGFDSYRRQAIVSDLSLDIDMEEDIGSAMVRGDPAQLYEAVSNLISNALKYTPEGGDIKLSLAKENGRAIFTVTDTGFGIPEGEQDKLFQPFFRAASEETNEIRGTGLGLHLVKNIIERHEGEMIFHSEYHKGSTFGFDLPLAESTDTDTD